MTELLGFLKDGSPVYDRYNSHLHSGVKGFLKQALSKIYPPEGEQSETKEVDFGRIIGVTVCVVTGPDDDICFAQRVGRKGPTRFVLNREAEPCASLTVALLRARDDTGYVCLTAYVGHVAALEPWDPRATEEDVEFWETHALICGSEEIIPGTERRTLQE